MFDVRRFWLGTAGYGVTIGAVIVAVCVAFNAFIGMPRQGDRPQQIVTQSAPVQGSGGNSAVPPPSPLIHRNPAPTNTAVAPQIFVPEPLIVPEPRSTRRVRSRERF